MPYTAEQRSEDVFLLASISEQILTNVAATATKVIQFRVPRACTIERLTGYYLTETGTTPSLTVELRTGTTAILSAAVTTADTLVSDTVVETSQSLNRDVGEELNIAYTSFNADNDFTGVSVQVWATRRES